ncbi:unnamed protein product [Mytilus coruscus]|uniref:Uncharacterized protein n=1 Tax=Mytilus coruscus TaxID=42192 RepID=A0A6J8BNS7_MYTCO|nr:unnamed protein product [Mytilus coruscus]
MIAYVPSTLLKRTDQKPWTCSMQNSIMTEIRTSGRRGIDSTEVRNKWRNTTRMANSLFSKRKTWGGHAPKPPSTAVERVVYLIKGHYQLQGELGIIEAKDEELLLAKQQEGAVINKEEFKTVTHQRDRTQASQSKPKTQQHDVKERPSVILIGTSNLKVSNRPNYPQNLPSGSLMLILLSKYKASLEV